jgi:cyclic pyranopterin phosphate synthase
MELTHFNESGHAKMVDVSGKDITLRTAAAAGFVSMTKETLALVKEGRIKKGDVLPVAQVAGIMAAKKTSDLIPMCHPLAITGADISFRISEEPVGIEIYAEVRCKGETGVEMEALTAVSVTALTIYDMCKAAERGIHIGDIRLLSKSGGKSGDYHAEEF